MKLWLGLLVLGAIGTLCRAGAIGAVQRLGGRFPWATLTVNLLGCLAFGLVLALAERGRIGDDLRRLLLVGFMGAFTTFSSFAGDTLGLLQSGRFGAALLNVLGQNVLGVSFVALGTWLGRG